MASSSASVALVPHPSLFDIPELIELIAQHLPNHDIVQCMATSKTLARQLEPFLWRHVVLKSSRPVPPNFTYRRHWIHSLSVAVSSNDLSFDSLASAQSSSHDIHHSIDSPQIKGYDKLHSINIESMRDWARPNKSSFAGQMLGILQQSRSLTNITLQHCLLGGVHEPLHIQAFLDILEHSLPHLQHLTLIEHVVEYDFALKFLSVCFNHHQLTDLHCGFFADDNQQQSLEAIDKPTMSRIKALILPRSMFTSRTLCTLLKDHLPNIERFHFHDVDNNLGNDLIASFQDAVEQGCRNLQHVNFTCSHSNRNVEEVIKGVVSGCKEWGLRSFCGVEYGERKHKNRNSLMKRLLDYHANTLEIVELESYKVIASHDLVRLFHECKNLRRAKIVPDRIDYRRALYYDDIVSKEWVCRDLEELHILLARRRCDSEEEDDSDDKAPMQLLKRVFEQIGRSTKLEVLCLAASVFGNMGLNLEHGGLSHLVGLKKLRHLGMTEELWLEVGQAEVEFMDSQWPQLESVSFRSTHMSGVATKPHWQWLQERRPTLNYFESVR